MKITKRNKVIIKTNVLMKLDDLDRAREAIKKDLEKDGFVLLDNRYDVYILSEEEDSNG